MSDHIMMGITVEDLQQKIHATYELAKSQEGVDLKAEADSLKAAIKANPNICQHLLPEDIGELVAIVKGFHASARKEALESPTEKKKKAKADEKAAKELISKPMSVDEFDDL